MKNVEPEEDYFGLNEEPAPPAPNKKPRSPRKQAPQPADTSPSDPEDSDELPWPDEVPILVAADVSDERTTTFDGRGRPLVMWLLTAFPPGTHVGDAMRERAAAVLVEVLTELYPPLHTIGSWSLRHTPTEAAAAWNEAMARLGYQIPKKKR